MDFREDNREVRIAAGCSLACPFCTLGEGREGFAVADVIAGRIDLPEADRYIVLAGNLIDERHVPLVARLKAAGAAAIDLYAHSGVSNPAAMKALADSGMTGIRLVLPAATKEDLASMTNGRGSLKTAATLLAGAAALGLEVTLEVPVTGKNAGLTADTVARAARLSPIRMVILSFVSMTTPDGEPERWDPLLAKESVEATIAFCRDKGVEFRLSRNEAPPPCILPLPDVPARTWGDLAGNPLEAPPARATAPYQACAVCAAAAVCQFTGRHLKPSMEPMPLTASHANDSTKTWLDSAAIWVRRNELRLLRKALAERHPICLNPWTHLETHSVRGVAICCATHRFQYGTVDRCVSWHDVSLKQAWNSGVMQGIRHQMKIGTPHVHCRPDCVVFHGGGPGDSWLTADPLTDVFHQNLTRNLQEIIDGAEELESMPQNLVIAPSLHCNIACIMCRFPGEVRDAPSPELTRMSDRQFDEVIEMMPYLRVLNITGGEPLMADGTRRLLRSFKTDRYLDGGIALTTNGILLEPSLIADMKQSRLLSIIVSVNAATRATYEHVTGVDAFERVMQNITNLMSARNEMRPQPRVVMSFVLMKCNYRELPAYITAAARLGADIQMLPMVGKLGNESMFMNESNLRELDGFITAEVAPLVAGMRQNFRREVATLQSTIRRRLIDGDYSMF